MWQLLLAQLLLWALPVQAESIYSSSNNVIHFSNLDAEQILSNSVVNVIMQDPEGFIWIGTQDGVNRYDGSRMDYFNHIPGEKSSLAFNWVWDIHVDNQGQIWIVGDGGISRYLGGENFLNLLQGEQYSDLKSKKFRVVAESSEGELWFGNQENGILVYAPATGNIRQYQPDTQDPTSLNSGKIRDLYFDAQNRLWVATFDGGLNVKMPNSDSFRHFNTSSEIPLPSDNIRTIFEDTLGRLWLGTTDQGVFIFDINTGVSAHYKHNAENKETICDDYIKDIYQDQLGKIWFATEGGLCQFQEETGAFIRHLRDESRKDSILSDRVLRLFQDQGGVMWVGSYGGVSRWNANLTPFSHVSRSFGVGTALSSNVITSFAMDRDETLYVGTWGGGLNIIEPNSGTIRAIRAESGVDGKLQDDRVMSLLVDAEQNLWLGTVRNGLHLREAGSETFRNFRHDPEDPKSLSSNAISKIIQLKSGSLVVGSYGGGINIKTGSSTFKNYSHKVDEQNSLSSDRVMDLLEDSEGNLWISTNGGGVNRFRLDTGNIERFQFDVANPQSIGSNDVYGMLETSSHIWFATQTSGVARLNKHQLNNGKAAFEHITRREGLPSNVTYGLLEDHLGYVWVSHTRGLSRLTPSTLEVMNFNTSHGLQGSDFNTGAYYKSENGRMFFGGGNGFNTFIPGKVPINVYQPPIRLTRYANLNREVPLQDALKEDGVLELSYQNAFISFEFAALDFTKPEDNYYQYKLDGLNTQWIDSGNINRVTFSNLLDGRYTFYVRGTNNNGIWGREQLSIPIRVLPPIWRTWQAYLIYSLLTMVLLIMGWRRYTEKSRQRKQYQAQLEAEVKERTEDLKKVNDALQSSMEETDRARKAAELAASAKADFLATMSHEIRTPLNSIIGMTELLLTTSLSGLQERYTNSAHRAGGMLLELINDILDFSKMEAGKIELERKVYDYHNLVEETAFLFANRAQEKGVELTYQIDDSCPRFFVGDALRLRQIIANLLSNSIKFTHKGYVEITTYSDGKSLYLHVADTGIGMTENQLDKIFNAFQQADTSTTRKFGGTGLGLSITKKLVELMGGHIGVDSSPGKGTVFATAFPVKVAKEQPEDLNLELLQQCKIFILIKNTAVKRMALNVIKRLKVAFKDISELQPDSIDDKPDSSALFLVDANILKLTEWQEKLSRLSNQVILLTSAYDEVNHASIVPTAQSIGKPIRRSALHEVILACLHGETAVRRIEKPAAFAEDPKFNAKILIAEDAKTNQEVAIAMLAMFGCEVEVADDGSIAFESIKQNHYDLVFMDCQMPILDGFEATRKIRAWEQKEDRSPITIVALTAGVGLGYEERSIVAGMDDYMTKPFKAEQLLAMLNKHLSHLRFEETTVTPDSAPSPSPEAALPSTDPIVEVTETPAVTTANEVDEWVDMEAINSIREIESSMGKAIYPKVLKTFEAEMAEKIPLLKQALEAQDQETIRKTAHAIKSLSANSGARQIRRLCAETEKAAGDGNIEQCRALLEGFDSHYQASLEALKRIAGEPL